jgi:two-component system, LytTR family, response regulator AlgR
MTMTLDVLVVDDEALARSRLRTLLGDCTAPGAGLVAEAGDAADALRLLEQRPFDAVLLDIRMPGMDGIALARTLGAMSRPPAIVFVTAHSEHAVQAFDLEAVDYLTKPVKLERLQQALQKVERHLQSLGAQEAGQSADVLVIQDRGRTERVPLPEVLYLKAELKYITVRTARRSYILDGSLNELEERHGAYFLRIHRNALISRRAVRALEKHYDAEEGEGWAVRLNGLDELLAVSRRQVSAVREALARI